MGYKAYDKYAQEYDSWFLANENVLLTELALVARCLENSGRVLSIGCGSGLFEQLLDRDYGIKVTEGIEPSVSMAEIARKRGMTVTIATAEDVNMPGEGSFDTLLFNGCPCYINDLQKAFDNTSRYLRPGGKIVVIDVPKESSYAMLYNLAMTLGTWDHPLLEGIKPPMPYPIEFVSMANWRTTEEKVSRLKASGYGSFSFSQTLTAVPLHSNDKIEQPLDGCDKGSYVAICAFKER
ncbi:MAG: class I SAM-dependent methyltransferase [Bacteroidales bacterium]|nr:class I SAM-dependent methyltransferase [Bacteroidales bacterium]